MVCKHCAMLSWKQSPQTNPSHIDLHVPVQVFCLVNKPPPFLYCTRVCVCTIIIIIIIMKIHPSISYNVQNLTNSIKINFFLQRCGGLENYRVLKCDGHIVESIIERGRVSYSSILPCTAVVQVKARSMIFTMCGVIVGSRSHATRTTLLEIV